MEVKEDAEMQIKLADISNNLKKFISLLVIIVLGVSVFDYSPWGRGFDFRHFHNFKYGLDLENGPPSLVRTTR